MAKKRAKKSTKVYHKTKEDDSVTYVKVDQPHPLRRDILETAIESAELLKNWEGYQKLKEDKVETFKKLVEIMKKVEKEISSLKRNIPKMDDIDVEEEKPVKPKKVEEVLTESSVKKEYRSDLDKEIDEIHSKLKNLKI
jgi:hypothetical protein